MQGLMSAEHWEAASTAALKLFAFGQEQAAARGLLLVDTKYEFGLDANGRVLLIDEVHTPDSSRYWLADSYEERFAAGQVQFNVPVHVQTGQKGVLNERLAACHGHVFESRC